MLTAPWENLYNAPDCLAYAYNFSDSSEVHNQIGTKIQAFALVM